MDGHVIRCGDKVYHRPSMELWLVAFCEGDELAMAGWPGGIARTSECRLVYAATDHEHRAEVQHWLDKRIPDFRTLRVAALYAPEAAAGIRATAQLQTEYALWQR